MALWKPPKPEVKKGEDRKDSLPKINFEFNFTGANDSLLTRSKYQGSINEARNSLNSEPFRNLESLRGEEINSWNNFVDAFQKKPIMFEDDFKDLNLSQKSTIINFALSGLSEKQANALDKVSEHYCPQDIFKYILKYGVDKTKSKLDFIGDYFEKKSDMDEYKSQLIDEKLFAKYDERSISYLDRFVIGELEEGKLSLKETTVKAIKLILADLEPGESKEFIVPLTDPSFTKKHYHGASIIKADDYSETNQKIYVAVDDKEKRLVNIFTGRATDLGNDVFSLEVNLNDASVKKHSVTSIQRGGVDTQRAFGFISQVYDGNYYGGRGPLIKTKTKDGEVKNTEYILENEEYPDDYIEILANLKGMELLKSH
ncbi:MAG: hypothetical protein HRT47_04030 [Candidatus Caenarcaniphilales bacterium]|nr:hypothetical protein [Candidatus Caenarcaniphilales bacterium]